MLDNLFIPFFIWAGYTQIPEVIMAIGMLYCLMKYDGFFNKEAKN